ncbi:MAG: hypothetical protein RBR45_01620 [Pseudomonas sp.]|nr:hypothetical protein [Pseudomonas sp.]
MNDFCNRYSSANLSSEPQGQQSLGCDEYRQQPLQGVPDYE